MYELNLEINIINQQFIGCDIDMQYYGFCPVLLFIIKLFRK